MLRLFAPFTTRPSPGRTIGKVCLFCAIALASSIGLAEGPVFEPSGLTAPRLPHERRQVDCQPAAQTEISVVEHHSQLIVGRAPIVRTAVAEPNIADVVQYSKCEIGLLGLAAGSTTLMIWFDCEPEPLVARVRVLPDRSCDEFARLDCAQLESRLATLFPKSQVSLTPVSGRIVVQGQACNPYDADSILAIVQGEALRQGCARDGSSVINRLSVPPAPQVMLQLRIIEVNRAMLQRIGVDLSSLFQQPAGFADPAAAGLPFTTGVCTQGDARVMVESLLANGSARVVAEPHLMVLSGHEARVVSGGEFETAAAPPGAGGAYRAHGVSVAVAATVMACDRVQMRIAPEYSRLAGCCVSADGTPALDVRRLETTVEVPNGQSVVLAGLLAESPAPAPGCQGRPVYSALRNVGHRFRRSCPEPVDVLIVVTPQILPCGGAVCATGATVEPLPPIDAENPVLPNPYELPVPKSAVSHAGENEFLPLPAPHSADERNAGLFSNHPVRRVTPTAGGLHPSQSIERPPLGSPGPLRTSAQANSPPRASTSWFGFRWLRPASNSR
ncbi:MAG TPA: pilus assembly protein N-terminal domain-containing protein [Planctomycetaceae bacterium]|nr:pilus assembly protein N-terminal domain-containing protein [Planctomycetaceae bacterium]